MPSNAAAACSHTIGLGYLERDITEDLRVFLSLRGFATAPAIIEPARLGELLLR
jgi:hypothetical protein